MPISTIESRIASAIAAEQSFIASLGAPSDTCAIKFIASLVKGETSFPPTSSILFLIANITSSSERRSK